MYFVDQSKIEEILIYMDKILKELGEFKFHTFAEKLGYERMVHVLIESTLDVGSMMIDGFIMRDPGSYEDIIDILVDEKVIPCEEQDDYKVFISLRKMLVTDYIDVDHEKLKAVMDDKKANIEQFSSHIRTYINNELGVANAFSNK
ncbi:DUF86 domain-containing protein [Oceanobacillus bengalensis]|uniref:DUF86 domain-containing protein n=1 Tax=Oceanobacillus bengalensis TaxID=1435466 RepID=A0A494YWJ5_9BACI|nr:DUF86 domain-containing protein [Oceanobacillus bengalensis]RKQ14478.1 DUF86 domain-containing protein [Oceanobacillus bengalensis]